MYNEKYQNIFVLNIHSTQNHNATSYVNEDNKQKARGTDVTNMFCSCQN